MTEYWRIRLGREGAHAQACLSGGFVGLDYRVHIDLTGRFGADWRQFNAGHLDLWLERNPGKSRVAAGLACGALWSLGQGMAEDDVLLAPDGNGRFHLGKVTGGYTYAEGEVLPHRRQVQWETESFEKDHFSEDLWRSLRGPQSLVSISKHAGEIAPLAGGSGPVLSVDDDTVEDPSAFALEAHLEDFLVANWSKTALASEYDLYVEDGEVIGQQFPTDTGPMDLLAVSKDGSTLLVVELKRGRASDVVVGQIQRYMGFVKAELATEDQQVRGAIIALEDSKRLRRALEVAPAIDFYRYRVHFELEKGAVTQA